MTVQFQSQVDQFMGGLRAKANRGIARCTVHLHNVCRELVSKSFPPASKRGEPPRLRTGFGKSNIAFELDQTKIRGRVGVRKNAFYMAVLEIKHDRPWLRATYAKEKATLARLFMSETG